MTCMLKIARIEGEFDWHAHEDEDEMFFVIEGAMDMGFRDRTERVETGQMIIVQKALSIVRLLSEGRARSCFWSQQAR